MKRPYTNTEIARIVRMRIAGWHPQQIAEMVMRSKKTIDRLLSIEKAKHGYIYPRIPRPDRKWTDTRIEQAAWRSANCTLSYIGSQHRVSPQRMSALMAMRARRLQEGTWMG